VNWKNVHSGQHRQGYISPDEIEAAQAAGLTPGINPDLHAPEISNPANEPELNLHGDVAGSPFSSTPGEISLAQAGDKGKDANAAKDDAGTRAVEMESRRTGVSTGVLAAEDEGNSPTPKPPAARK
jgi:hypothetical protein